MKKNGMVLVMVVIIVILGGCFSVDKSKDTKENEQFLTTKERIKQWNLDENLEENVKRATGVRNGIYLKDTTKNTITFYSFVDYLALVDTSFIDKNKNAYLIYKNKYVDMLSFYTDITIVSSSFISGTNKVKSLVGTNLITNNVFDIKGNLIETGYDKLGTSLLTIKDVYAVNDLKLSVGVNPLDILPKECSVTLSNKLTCTVKIKEWKTSSTFSLTEPGIYKYIGTIAESKEYTNPSNLTFTSLVSTTIFVTGITLNKNSITLNVDSTDLIIGKIVPSNAMNQQIIYESSDPTIASVDSNGKINAIKKGTIQIIAKSAENKAIIASCLVEVKPITITKIESDVTELIMTHGPSKKVNIKLIPTNAIGTLDTITWDSNELISVTEDKRTGGFWLFAWGPGKTTVTARLKDNPNIFIKISIKIN